MRPVSSIKTLRAKIGSDNTLPIISKAKQSEITRLNETRELLEFSIEEQENKLISNIQMILFLKEDFKLFTPD